MSNYSSFRYDSFYERYPNLDPGDFIKFSSIHEMNVVPLAVYVCLFAVGICGNLWVACVMCCVLNERKTRAPRSVQIYISALCCCDLIVLCFSLTLIVDLIYDRWLIESNFLCRLYLCSESLNKFCAPFFLVALSSFCCMKICGPACGSKNCFASNEAKNAKTSDYFSSRSETNAAIAVAVFCPIFSFVLSAPLYTDGGLHYIVYSNQTGHVTNVLTKCAFEPSERVAAIFTVYGFVFGYAVPTALFVLFHAAILYAVRRQTLYSNVGRERRRAQHYFVRVAKTILALVVFYVVCWTPYWTMSMYQLLKPLDESSEEDYHGGIIIGYIIHCLPYVNCCGYPIVYTLLNKDIRESYKRAKENNRRKRTVSAQSSFFFQTASTVSAKFTNRSKCDDSRPRHLKERDNESVGLQTPEKRVLNTEIPLKIELFLRN